MMLTTNIGSLETSRIALGAWAIGGGTWWGDNDDSESIDTIRAAIDGGINYIDTAPAYGYGHSEMIVGKAVKGIREKVKISTKGGLIWDTDEGAYFFEKDGKTVLRNLSKQSLKKQVEDSLRRLDTDYIDIYFTHWQSLPEFPITVEETMGALLELKQEGKILSIGISNTNPDNLTEYLRYGKVDIIQEKFSILTRMNKEILGGIAEANDVVFQPYQPLESGLLTGKLGPDYEPPPGSSRSGGLWFEKSRFLAALEMIASWAPLCEKYGATPGQLAIAWTVALGDGVSVLVGARTVEQVTSNIKGGEITLAAEDISFMTKSADDVIKLFPQPDTRV